MQDSQAPYAQVWVEAGREGQVFTYANPEALALAPGDLVQVSLRGRPHTGLLVALADTCPPEVPAEALQPIVRRLQPAALDPSWQGWIETVAEQCHTSLFRTLKAALPAGWLGQRPRRAPAQPRQRWWIERTDVCPDPPTFTERQQALLDHLDRHGGGGRLDRLCGRDGFSRAVLKALETRGVLRRRPLAAADPDDSPDVLAPALSTDPSLWPQLTPAQAEAVERINASGDGAELLLWGVTGAGKTEVYLQAVAAELARGRHALVLAPEIGLVPQLLDRFRRRFPGRVLEYHSGLGDAERLRAWRAALADRDGHPLVVIGTRSAVFLPLRPLGLIVLDEEHDSSYKQDSPMPCYHAREVARLRVAQQGGRLVLGSATPALETWWRARSEGAVQLLSLPERIGSRPLPPVRVVDMRHELAEGHRRLLSRALIGRLETLQDRGEQAVVLVPRRGYHTFLSCRSCGEAVVCPHCDVSLTVHRVGARQWLRCHWCNHRQELADRCSHCGSTAYKPFGAGTQRVMDQLMTELEGLRVLRFDRDTTRGRDGHRRLLERFAAGDADVLVGTQMLAKGMDLPAVTLAAVLAADGLLHRPDLRAAEQGLQLLLQLAGRAGRGVRPGEVLVQTYTPEHPVIRHLVDGRYERFLEEELAQRRAASLVPFQRACLLRLSGPAASTTATAAAALAEQIRARVMEAAWWLLGPAPEPVARVAGRSRWQILLHGPRDSPLPLPPEAELRRALPAGVGLTIDPDPLQL
ncbi:MAG: primosomal protein N' [Cyanobacteriota bacterium]